MREAQSLFERIVPPSLCGTFVALPTRRQFIDRLSLIAARRHGERATGRPSLPTLPPPALIGLPIGDLESPRFAIGPGRSRSCERFVIVAVEDEHHALISVRV